LTGWAGATPVQRSWPLQPATYRSRSGEFELDIDPARADRKGPALYALRRNGMAIWKREHPFALQDAVVSNSGIVAGEGVTSSPADPWGNGDLILAVFSAEGEVETCERFPLTMIGGPEWSSTRPIVVDLFVQEDLRRVVFRGWDFRDPREERRDGIAWWAYDLAGGPCLWKRWREKPMQRPRGSYREVEATALPGTGLALVYWMGCDPPEGSWSCNDGAVFSLLDAELKEVWQLRLPEDYAAEENERAAQALRREIRSTGAILATEFPGVFELRFVASRERVRFVARPDSSSEAGWRVEELERSPYLPSLPVPRNLPSPITLERLPSVGLENASGPKETAVWDVLAFAFGEDESFHLLRKGGDDNLIDWAHVDRNGIALAEALIRNPIRNPHYLHWARLRNGAWVGLTPDPSEYGRTRCFRISPDVQVLDELPHLDATVVTALAPGPAGGFVAIHGRVVGTTFVEQVSSHDAQGQLRWSLTSESPAGRGWE
jgi:hypothetical protein